MMKLKRINGIHYVTTKEGAVLTFNSLNEALAFVWKSR